MASVSLTRRSLLAGAAAGTGAVCSAATRPARRPGRPPGPAADPRRALHPGRLLRRAGHRRHHALDPLEGSSARAAYRSRSRATRTSARDLPPGRGGRRRERVLGPPPRQHSVLAPGEQYFYRFYTCDENSPVGRFRTARPADSREPVRIGVLLLPGLRGRLLHRARRAGRASPTSTSSSASATTSTSSSSTRGRAAGPTGANGDGEVQTLDEYRAKYALYHSDPRLLEVRRQLPAA